MWMYGGRQQATTPAHGCTSNKDGGTALWSMYFDGVVEGCPSMGWWKDAARLMHCAYLCPQWVGLDIVPKEYGGEAEAVPMCVAVQRLRQQKASGNASRSSGLGAGPLATGVAEAPVGGQACQLCAAGECRCGWQKVAQAQVLQVEAACEGLTAATGRWVSG